MIKDIKAFIQKRKMLLLFEIFLVFVVFGIGVLNPAVSIDTDSFINSPRTTLNWLFIGRQGLVLTKKLFGTMWFNPYVATVMGFVCIVGYLILICYLLDYINGGKKQYNYYLFSMLFITHPAFVFQWFFKLQVFEFSFSMLLLVLAEVLLFRWIKEGRKIEGLFSIVPLIWSFASYQANIVLFIAMTIVSFLILGKGDFKEAIQDCIKMIGVFLTAFIINQLISSIFFTNSDYLESYVMWGKGETIDCLKNIKHHIGDVVLGRGMFSYAYVFLLFGIIVMFLLEIKDMSLRLFFDYIAFGVLMIVPFFLTIYSGAYEETMFASGRVQYPLAFILGSGYMILIGKYRQMSFNWKGFGHVLSGIACALAIVFGIQQLQFSLRLWYTDAIRYRQDCNMLNRIVDTMYEQGLDPSGDDSIAFIGKYQVPLNGSCLEPMELIGISYFNLYTQMPPYYYITNTRISSLADVEGIYKNYNLTIDETKKARIIAENMPSWPSKGSIKEEDGIIVIKLSDDDYPKN